MLPGDVPDDVVEEVEVVELVCVVDVSVVVVVSPFQ